MKLFFVHCVTQPGRDRRLARFKQPDAHFPLHRVYHDVLYIYNLDCEFFGRDGGDC